MDKKDNNFKENSIAESIEAQFDDLFAQKKTDEVSDAGKKTPVPDTPANKKVSPKKPLQKPVNKKADAKKTPVSQKQSSTSGKPAAKADQQKFKPDETLIEKKTPPPVPEAKSKPHAKQDTDISLTKREVSPEETEDTQKTAVENVFKKANLEYKKNVLWEKVKQGLNPLRFSWLILLLIALSIFNGMIMDSDGILEFLNIKGSSTSTLTPLTVRHTGKRKVSVPKAIKTPVPEENISEVKIEKTDIQKPDTIEEEAPRVSTNPLPLVENNDKSNDITNDVVKEKFKSYPYSVYLGSYNSIEKVEAVLSDYKEMGLTSYWVKLDLGEKGIWYRHFVGYFQSREKADAFIKTKQLKEAESRLTKYAILIGVYSSEKDLGSEETRLKELSYSPYIISDSKDVYRLYTGAFYQKNRVKELKDDLKANGITGELVER